MTEPERCSKAEYARLRGISDSYVSRLHRKHRLVLDDRGLVIVKSTDALVNATRDPTRGGDRTGKHARRDAAQSPTAGAASAGMPGARTENAPPFPAGATPATSARPADPMSLADAVRAEKIERTRKLLIENAREAGLLVRRDEVDAEVFKRARQAQEALMAMKDRLVPLLAIESDEQAIDALLDRELRHVLASLSGGASAAGERIAA